MAYNQNNLLDKIEKVQAIWAKHNLDERTNEWIFHHHILHQFHISKRTFDAWLARNVARERRLLQEKKDKTDNQATLFDDTDY